MTCFHFDFEIWVNDIDFALAVLGAVVDWLRSLLAQAFWLKLWLKPSGSRFKPSWAGSCCRRYRTPRFRGFLASV